VPQKAVVMASAEILTGKDGLVLCGVPLVGNRSPAPQLVDAVLSVGTSVGWSW
jgi:hypothetical protein